MEQARLLLVDDDALMRDVLTGELDDAGFAVVAVEDGTRALAELDADATRFKAVVTDINIGAGPSGWDVGRRARECVADMPVVYISGASGNEWSAQGVPDSVIITKPFAPAQLITAISMLIAEADKHRQG
jgi:DNA-binding response OmpR family regulator